MEDAEWEQTLLELEQTTLDLVQAPADESGQVERLAEQRAAAVWRVRQLVARRVEPPEGVGERIQAAIRGGEEVMHRFRILREVTVAQQRDLETKQKLLRDLAPATAAGRHADYEG